MTSLLSVGCLPKVIEKKRDGEIHGSSWNKTRSYADGDFSKKGYQFSSVTKLCLTPWAAACQASLSFTVSRSLLMSIKLVIPSNHLILCHPRLLLPPIFPSIRVFSNESVLHIRWPKYWSFSFSISPSREYSGLIPFRFDWFDLLLMHSYFWEKFILLEFF